MARTDTKFYDCSPICSDDTLAAIQIATGILTSEPIFASVTLEKSTKDFNSSLFADVEYSKFCDANKEDLYCIDSLNDMNFFNRNRLGNFSVMSAVF